MGNTCEEQLWRYQVLSVAAVDVDCACLHGVWQYVWTLGKHEVGYYDLISPLRSLSGCRSFRSPTALAPAIIFYLNGCWRWFFHATVVCQRRFNDRRSCRMVSNVVAPLRGSKTSGASPVLRGKRVGPRPVLNAPLAALGNRVCRGGVGLGRCQMPGIFPRPRRVRLLWLYLMDVRPRRQSAPTQREAMRRRTLFCSTHYISTSPRCSA